MYWYRFFTKFWGNQMIGGNQADIGYPHGRGANIDISVIHHGQAKVDVDIVT